MPTRTIELIRHPMRVRTLEVRAIRQPGPLYQLLTLGGAELADFESPSPTDHVGLVPPTDTGALILPQVVDDRLRWSDREHPPMREYTVRRFDPQALELDVRVLRRGYRCDRNSISRIPPSLEVEALIPVPPGSLARHGGKESEERAGPIAR